MKERKELIAIVAGVIVVAIVLGIFLTMFLISS
jgi:hypothetical protein